MMMCNLLSLPPEIHFHIFSFLPLRSCLELSRCSKKLHLIFSEIQKIYIHDPTLLKKRYEILRIKIGPELGFFSSLNSLSSLSIRESQNVTFLKLSKQIPDLEKKDVFKGLQKAIASHDLPLQELFLRLKPWNAYTSEEVGLLAYRASESNEPVFLKKACEQTLVPLDTPEISLSIKQACKLGHFTCAKILIEACSIPLLCPLELGLSFCYAVKGGFLNIIEFFFDKGIVDHLPQRLFEEAFMASFSAPSLEGTLLILSSHSSERLRPECLGKALIKSCFEVDTTALKALCAHRKFSDIAFSSKLSSLCIFILTRSVEGLCINKTFEQN